MAEPNKPIIVIKKIKKGAHAHHGGAWKVAYADFVTAMMAFFLVMWIIGMSQEQREGIQRYFNDPMKYLSGSQVLNPGVFAGSHGSQLINSEKTGGVINSNKSGGITRLHLLARKIEASMEPFKPDIFALKVHSEKIQFAITAQSLFAPGSAKLRRQAEPLLNRIAEVIKNMDASIMIESHTDDLPPENHLFETNWELSALRASTVTRYFIEGHNMDPSKMTALGASQYRPIADNSSSEGRAKNRRIDFYIIPESQNRNRFRSTASEIDSDSGN